ncbi:M20/M25/M40 family metallo-hydrolase [Urechidicola croceus]|uniref:Carboxypeptidase Q n=1 Tax=Urechidicola croceus TaxID=1850246 RepID=A0A1D8PAX6_9FLAO|nr:M20/M25/M40 family metallo-hydrolase [Urechidicola croceus]AOW21733.1 peptidase M28 family protein [Urechidicola croceus]
MKKILLAFFTATIIISCNENKTTTNTISTNTVNKTDSIAIKQFFSTALTDGKAYEWLRDLTQNIGGRLSGSPEAQMAVEWGEKLMKEEGFDKVWLQPVMVPHWVRGEKEVANYSINGTKINVPICALGGSIATPKNGVMAEVIEVKSLDEVEKLGEKVRGKIIFYNRPFDNTLINTFAAYGGCVDQRYGGTEVAGKYGAVGTIVRSMTNNLDDYPHTGSMGYGKAKPEDYIPTAAISTNASELLSKHLKENPNLKFYFKQSCETLPDAPSFNVIGEIAGSEFPNKYITVGGHLDSWDLAEGAHDDGTGVVQSMEVLSLLKRNGIKPKHTIRAVLFMNEENGLRGGKKYAEEAKLKNEIHVAALESDSGGHTPRGFSYNGTKENQELFMGWKSLLEPYGLTDWHTGYAGADINPLKNETVTLSGYKPDSQRYFDYHHAATDTFDKVNLRELELGSAAMASLVYLMDKYLDVEPVKK